MPIRRVILTDRHDRFVKEQVIAGRYENVSEVLLAGLRLLQDQTQTAEIELATIPVRRILIPDCYRQFVEMQLIAGQYKNFSQVLRAGLQLLEHQAQTDEQVLRTTINRIGRRAAKASQHRKAL